MHRQGSDEYTSPTSANSNVEHVLRYLRNGIIDGGFAPSSKLLPKQIAESCGTSFIPVREAMRVLESEGFVSFVHNRGVWVTPLSTTDLQDIYTLRIELECEAVRRSEPFASASIAHLEDLLTRSTAAYEHNEHSVQLALNRELHFFIYEGANSPRRLKLIKELWLHSARYQRLSIGYRHDAADSEHREIVEMLSRADHHGAANALQSHLQTTVDLLRSQISDSGTEFLASNIDAT